ncbi:MAG: NAD(P)H-hydrate epimerase, partial [Eubacteriales bacterium]
MRVLTANQMRQLDAHMIKNNAIPGIVLMENAANGIFEICQTLANKDESVIHVFCGVGNNGGDGFATARILLSNGFSVKVYLVGSVSQLKGDAKTNADFFIQNNQINVIDSDHLDFKFSKHDVIIDALFGIGLSRNIEGVFKSVIAAINDAACPKIAVDVPSGLNADSGAVMGIAVHATHTVTFQRPKPAHFLQPGKSYCGKISIVKIGIEDGFAFDGDVSASSRTLAPLKLEKRNPNSHKGTYGTLGLLVSSKDMPGAGLMCATAALKSGVGLLHLFVPQSKKVMFSTAFPEAIVRTQADFLNEDFPLTAVACGPGLSKDDLAVKLVKKAISDYTSLPKVFDADALNIISEQSDLLTQLNEKTVVTPHPLEFSRL